MNNQNPVPNPNPAPVIQPLQELREPLLGCAIGKKGIGKTFTTLKTIYNYVAGNPALGIKGRKFLIFDANDEFESIKSISVKDIPRFSQQKTPEIRRVRIWRENGTGKMTLDEMADTLYFMLDNYRGGGMLIEDISKYTGDHYSRDIIGAICTQRHMDCDIIMHFQTIGKLAHPKIFGNMNYVRLHSTTDTVERHETKFGGDSEHLKLTESLVIYKNKNENPKRFCCYLNLDKLKITGSFSREDFYQAIDYYLNKEVKTTINPLLNRRDNQGKKIYTYASAVAEKREQLFSEYYGNPH